MVIGSVCAVEINDVSNTEDSNLTNDNAVALSQEKLEVSSVNSISETNLVNSHDDNLNDYPEDSILSSIDESYYEDNGEKVGLANENTPETISVSNDDVVLDKCIEDSSVSDSDKIGTTITVRNMYYSNTTVFKVVLQDVNGNYLKKQTVSLKVNGKEYTGKTSNNGNAYIQTATLPVGKYDVTLSYGGNSIYSPVSFLKKAKILPSLEGNNVNKVYGESKYYSVTFWNVRTVLSNTEVTFTIGDKKYTSKTDANGVAILKESLKPGKYYVTAVNPVSNEKITNKLIVQKDTTTTNGNSQVYVPINNYYYYYSVIVTSNQSTPVKNSKVSFSIANYTLTANTDGDGKATVLIPTLAKGTYNISYTFGGNEYYYSSSSSGKISFVNPSTKFIASNLKMKYNDGSKFSVTFTDNSGNPLADKDISFILNGKFYSSKTNSKGVASLSVGNLKPGTYKIRYMFSSDTSTDYNFGKSKIVVDKLSINLFAKNLVMKYNDGTKYKAYVTDNSGKPLTGIKVVFTINGKNYERTTLANGVAKLKVALPVGYYAVKSTISDSIYTASSVSKHILVNGTQFSASNQHIVYGYATSFSVKVLDGANKAIKNSAITFLIDGKLYNKKTDSNGVAKVYVGVLSSGAHKIKYYHDSTKGSSKIYVVDRVTLKQVIAASKTVKSYIEDNAKLPSKLKIGKVTVTTAEYLFLASEAIVNLNNHKYSNLALKKVTSPTKPGSAEDLGYLKKYIPVAKNLVTTVNSKAKMPNSFSSSVGTVGYDGLVYAFARVVTQYSKEGALPSNVEITTLSGYSTSTSSLNSKNTISNLAAYLAASTNCQVDNSKIKELVAKLTSGLTSKADKAEAIYNYVRDTISYSFYYDTKYGAVGTLDAKTGNCVDHSHLLVAMYRAAGLPARYVHGTCTFSSGTYGHVWTQVLIGDTWVVGDATSARNSFGNVVNWNADSYSLKGYYASISF